MALVSTIKEVFFSANSPTTLSFKLMFGTRAGVLESRPPHWNNSRRDGLGFWGEVGMSPDAPGRPCGHSTLQVWEVGTSPRVSGLPWGQSIFSVPIGQRLGMFLWGSAGLGMPLPSVLAGCIGSRVWGGGGLKPRSGMTWARLISFLNCCHQKGILSFLSCSFFFSHVPFLLLSIIEHLEGYF